MRTLIGAIAAVGITLFSRAAIAEENTESSGYYQRICGAAINALETKSVVMGYFETGKCAGFVDGVEQANIYYGKRLYCTPSGVTFEQMVRVWLKYLKDHPETLHLQAINTYSESQRSVFPCPPK